MRTPLFSIMSVEACLGSPNLSYLDITEAFTDINLKIKNKTPSLISHPPDSATVVHFTVTDHIPGHHIGLESAINLLRPRLELWFFANPAVANATTTANGTGADYRSSGQRHHLAEQEGGTTNVISGDAERHHHQPRRLPATAAVDGGHHRSSLGLKFYFKHNSFLFQVIIGCWMRGETGGIFVGLFS